MVNSHGQFSSPKKRVVCTSKWPFNPWFINGGEPYHLYTKWDDHPSRNLTNRDDPGLPSLKLTAAKAPEKWMVGWLEFYVSYWVSAY